MLLTEILTGLPTGGRAEHPLLDALYRYHHSRRTAISSAGTTADIDPTSAAAMHEIVLAEQQGDLLTPGQLTRVLAISTGATTALIDRLVSAGLITRVPHPTDRRKQLLRTHPRALPELHAAKAAITQRASRLSDHDAAVIVSFLNDLSTALET